jgi:phenylalanyl-tRNA synthetase beta chain
LVPEGAIELVAAEESLGFAWEAGPEAQDGWDLNRPVYLAQIRLDALPLDTGIPAQYREPSRFPGVRRDLALVVPGGITQASVREQIEETGGKQLVAIELFDHYQGKHIPSGHVGYGFRLTFRSNERTLEEQEVDAAVEGIVDGLRRRDIVRREG